MFIVTVGSQKFRKPLNALHVVESHPSSSHRHNSMALTIDRSRPARSRARRPNLTLYNRGHII